MKLDKRRDGRRFGLVGLSLFFLSSLAAPSLSQICNVPSDRGSVQAAVSDPSCSIIVLAAQTFDESVAITRSVTVQGAGSTITSIEGQVRVSGGGVVVDLSDLRVDTSTPELAGCFDAALVATGGTRINADSVQVRNSGGSCLLVFRDSFETGNTAAWSFTVP